MFRFEPPTPLLLKTAGLVAALLEWSHIYQLSDQDGGSNIGIDVEGLQVFGKEASNVWRAVIIASETL